MEEPDHPTAAVSEIVKAWFDFINEGRKDEDPSEGTAPGEAVVLRSVTSTQTWALGALQFPAHKLMSVLGLEEEEDAEVLSPTVDPAEATDGPADPVEEVAPFKSKYNYVFPLYQDYCQQEVQDYSEIEDMVPEDLVPEPIISQQCTALLAVQGLSQLVLFKGLGGTVPSPPTPRVHRATLTTFWQDLDEVKECGVLDTLSRREVHRQEAMFEVIGSEASYLRSLGVAVNHFLASKTLSRTVRPMQHHILFSNLRQVTSASEEFLVALERRLGECVVVPQLGDLVLQHCPRFQALYVPYLSNMMFQEALVNQLLQKNRRFASALKTLESDPACQKQNLKSFLVLPFQRITRLKLLMENILRLTEPDADSYLNLKEAKEALHKVIMECNEGVQRMKQMEELVHLATLLDFSNVKLLPLIVKGRFLLHEGPLRKLTEVGSDSRASFVDVYLHLFNDLLVISFQKERRFSVHDYASFPTDVHVKQLNASIGLPADSFLLHLSQNHAGQATSFILAAPSRCDTVAWMKALSAEN